MSLFPFEIFKPRTVENVDGVEYDPAELTTVFAEDKNFTNEQVVAMQKFLKGMQATFRYLYTDQGLMSRTADSEIPYNAVAYSPELDLFWAVGGDGGFSNGMSSTDTVTWDADGGLSSTIYRGVAWSPSLGIFVAVGSRSGDNLYTTWDGSGAKGSSFFGGTETPSCITWSPELEIFVAGMSAGSGNNIATSPDGENWNFHSVSPDLSIRDIVWSKELEIFVAVGDAGSDAGIFTSTDGETWTQITGTDAVDMNCVIWSAARGEFIAAGTLNGNNQLARSPDGQTWTFTERTDLGEVGDIAYSDGLDVYITTDISSSNYSYNVFTDASGLGSYTSLASGTATELIYVPERMQFVGMADATGGGDVFSTQLASERF